MGIRQSACAIDLGAATDIVSRPAEGEGGAPLSGGAARFAEAPCASNELRAGGGPLSTARSDGVADAVANEGGMGDADGGVACVCGCCVGGTAALLAEPDESACGGRVGAGRLAADSDCAAVCVAMGSGLTSWATIVAERTRCGALSCAVERKTAISAAWASATQKKAGTKRKCGMPMGLRTRCRQQEKSQGLHLSATEGGCRSPMGKSRVMGGKSAERYRVSQRNR